MQKLLCYQQIGKEAIIIIEKLDPENLNGIYFEIAQILSYEDCKLLFDNFKGLSINFPTKFIDPEYVKKYLDNELDKGKTFNKPE